jgi:predicted amino acid-binding ACT domain protein
MTILRGHFTMMLIVSVDDDLGQERLGKLRDDMRRSLDTVRERLALEALSLSDVEQLEGPGADPSHIVTVYGVDHPGIVNAVAAALAERQVDITDLTTRVFSGQDDTPVYAMMIEVAIPPGLEPTDLERRLRAIAAEQNVELSFRQLEQALL